MKRKTLHELVVGEKFKILGFTGKRIAMKINRIINIDKIIKIELKHPIHGPIISEVDGQKVAIGYGMAKKIFVEEYKK